MSTTEIRKRLHSYIELAGDRKIKALYTMVEEDIAEDKWGDKTFVSEMLKRSKDLKSGKVKGLSLEEVKKEVGKALKSAKGR